MNDIDDYNYRIFKFMKTFTRTHYDITHYTNCALDILFSD